MDRGACPRGHKEMDVTEHKLLSLKLCFFFFHFHTSSIWNSEKVSSNVVLWNGGMKQFLKI